MSKHWFLPQRPDVMQTLVAQADLTVEGASTFRSWAAGDPAQEATLRDLEHRANDVRRRLGAQLREAFSTPVDQEDLFTLSERLDAVLDALKNTVREASSVELPPDPPLAAMAAEIEAGVRALREAMTHLVKAKDDATREADAAASRERRLEEIYREAMHGLVTLDDLREVVSRAELYRRTLEVGARISRVADRIWYAVVKEA